MSAFSKAWSFLKSQNWERYDEEYAMFGGTEGLREQYEKHLDHMLETFGPMTDEYLYGSEPEPSFIGPHGEIVSVPFDEFAQNEIDNMNWYKNYFENTERGDALRDHVFETHGNVENPFEIYYSNMLDSGSNY